VNVSVQPVVGERNRLTVAFRIVLALPHLLLVGGPVAAALFWTWWSEEWLNWAGGGGALGAVAGLAAAIAWFAILFTGRYPEGLRSLAALYLRWRIRAVAYTALLTDEYPPFGDGPYPTRLDIARPGLPRNRVSVAFRIILAIPHLLALWVLGAAWALTTLIAWFYILVRAHYPQGLYDFGVGVLRWNTRVEAYLLLLHDEYPPFSLH
jgi:hypothetical protein